MGQTPGEPDANAALSTSREGQQEFRLPTSSCIRELYMCVTGCDCVFCLQVLVFVAAGCARLTAASFRELPVRGTALIQRSTL